MPELPNIVIRKLAERELHPGASHPDADLLTAFVESALPDRERGTVLTHLAACAPCREIVALAQPAEIATSTVLAPKPSRSLFLLRWGALAACAALAISVAVLHERKSAESPLLAKNGVLEQKSEPPASAKAILADATRGDTNKAEADTGEKQPAPVTQAVAPRQGRENERPSAIARRYDAETILGINPKSERSRTSILRAPAAMSGNAGFVGHSAIVGGNLAPHLDMPLQERGRAQGGGAPATPSASPAPDPVIDISVGSAIALRRGTAHDDSQTPSAETALKKEPPSKEKASGRADAADSVVEVDASATASTTPYAPTDKDEFRASSAQLADLPDLATARQAGTWQITAEGKLQRSLDGGKSWESVAVDPNGRLRVVTATGFQVWAGGNGGVLLHSWDAGDHFMNVKVRQKRSTLKGDIVTLSFPDAQHGRLETADHDVWTTNDGGKTWQPSAAVK